MNLLSIRQFEKETDFTKKNITEKCLNSNIKLTEESNIELQDLLLKIKTEMANFKVSAKSFYSKKLEEIQLKNDSNLNEIINKSFIAIDSHTESLSSLNFKNFQSLTTHDDKQTEKNSDLNSVTNSFDQFFESYQIPFLKKRYLEFEIEKQNLTMKIKKAKRILGPDGSIEPPYEIKSEKLNINNREFNRESKQLRPLCMRIDTIKQANGSAYVELGDLKVVCAVYGPRQSLKPGNSSAGSLNCDFKFAPFSCKKRRPYPKDTQEKEYGLLLNQALVPSLRLDLLPKSVIDIYVQVLEADGMVSSLAAAVTCASLALANAGIEMYDFVSGASAGYVDNSIILDCDLSEEEKINFNGSIFLSYMPASNEVTHIVQWGEVNYANSAKAIEICVDACSQIHSVMSQTLLNSIKD